MMKRTDAMWTVAKLDADKDAIAAVWGPYDTEQGARNQAAHMAEINVGEDFYILSAQYVASKRVVFDKIEDILF
jgi:hypothetical protein